MSAIGTGEKISKNRWRALLIGAVSVFDITGIHTYRAMRRELSGRTTPPKSTGEIFIEATDVFKSALRETKKSPD